MKQLLIVTNIILLGVAGFLGYKLFNVKDVKSGVDSILEKGKENEKCASRLCKDYSNVEWSGMINASMAREMALDYRSDRGKNIIWFDNTASNTPDATSIWFDLEKLKKFIWEIESRQCAQNCGDTLGVRIYYAKYPDTTGMQTGTLAMLRSAYANHHTLFMVPTYWDWNLQANVDFDPINGCRGKFFMADTSKPGLILFDMGSGDGDAQNHGSLIPPGTTTGTGF